MKIVTYNLNGIRASKKNGVLSWLKDFDADIYCFQEVRASEEVAKKELFGNFDQLSFLEEENDLKHYTPIFNCGKVAGYAGTATLCKVKPDKTCFDMEELWTDDEGRTTTAFFGNLAVVNAYVPNGNSRLDFKMKYLNVLGRYLHKLSQEGLDILCVGDFNIAHKEIDLSNPKECENKSVFLPKERMTFLGLLLAGNLVDSFRLLNPDAVKYSWPSKKNGKGVQSYKYRIDYILVSKSLEGKLKECEILDLPYSDHLPVVLEIEV